MGVSDPAEPDGDLLSGEPRPVPRRLGRPKWAQIAPRRPLDERVARQLRESHPADAARLAREYGLPVSFVNDVRTGVAQLPWRWQQEPGPV